MGLAVLLPDRRMHTEFARTGRKDQPLGRILTTGAGTGPCIAPLALRNEGPSGSVFTPTGTSGARPIG